MRQLLTAVCALIFVSTSAVLAASAPVAPLSQPAIGVDLLSDTNGVNMQPYMSHLISDLRQRWLSLVARAQMQSSSTRQETSITLALTPAGHLAAMHMDDATHVAVLDQAAWSAAKEASYLPLPTGSKAANLTLRVHFVLNPAPTDR